MQRKDNNARTMIAKWGIRLSRIQKGIVAFVCFAAGSILVYLGATMINESGMTLFLGIGLMLVGFLVLFYGIFWILRPDRAAYSPPSNGHTNGQSARESSDLHISSWPYRKDIPPQEFDRERFKRR